MRDATPAEALPIIRVGEMVMDLHSSGITATSCLVVRKDGSFHLENRFQKLPRPGATLHIYKAALNGFEMSRLESILDSSQLRNLGEYKPPTFPVAVSRSPWFMQTSCEEIRPNHLDISPGTGSRGVGTLHPSRHLRKLSRSGRLPAWHCHLLLAGSMKSKATHGRKRKWSGVH
jgi:hypothetical protein